LDWLGVGREKRTPNSEVEKKCTYTKITNMKATK
jgi:hypothetical protein